MPYEVVKWQRNPDHTAPKALKDVHPLGLAPIIIDGDTIVAESGAIVRMSLICSPRTPNTDGLLHTEYLLRKYGKPWETLPESAQIDDIYSAFSVIMNSRLQQAGMLIPGSEI